MSHSIILKILIIVLLFKTNFLFAEKFDPNIWKTITKEQFMAENMTNKTVIMQKLSPDSQPLDSPRNIKAFEILTWALVDKDEKFRKQATWETVEFLTKFRNCCRGKNIGKLPLKRELLEGLLASVKVNFDSPDLVSRADAIRAHIWIRGNGKDCEDVAIKLINELSIDITEQWGRREWLLNLMVNTGSKKAEALLSYPHPNSRKKGHPVVGTKLVPYKYKAGDNTWFDFLENSAK